MIYAGYEGNDLTQRIFFFTKPAYAKESILLFKLNKAAYIYS